jgi:hypothetical protein
VSSLEIPNFSMIGSILTFIQSGIVNIEISRFYGLSA